MAPISSRIFDAAVLLDRLIVDLLAAGIFILHNQIDQPLPLPGDPASPLLQRLDDPFLLHPAALIDFRISILSGFLLHGLPFFSLSFYFYIENDSH